MLPTVRRLAGGFVPPDACVVIAGAGLPPRILKFRAPAAAKTFRGRSYSFVVLDIVIPTPLKKSFAFACTSIFPLKILKKK